MDLDVTTVGAIRSAVVTGGSSGIGAAFINSLAKLDSLGTLCNISRTKPDNSLANDRLFHISADLSDRFEMKSAAKNVRERLDLIEGPILLINNSGYGSYGPFDSQDVDDQINMINLNVSGLVGLTGELLPMLKEKGGVVINVASVVAFYPAPAMATYAATKAFVLNWSLALSWELQEFPVKVLALCPGPTRSKFFQRAGLSGGSSEWFEQSAEAVVEEAWLALQRGKNYHICGWKNRFMLKCALWLPLRMRLGLFGRVIQQMRMNRTL